VPGTPDDTEIITLRSKLPLDRLRVEPCEDGHGEHRGWDWGECR
jgi:hypothetical protein